MPFYRCIIRGRWEPRRSDYAGFFTSRAAAARAPEEAEAAALAALAREWTEQPFLPDGGTGLQLAVLDSWRVGWWAGRRPNNRGHTFYRHDEDAAQAAGIEAQATRAPRGAAIWRLAARRGDRDYQYHVLD